MKNPIHNPSSGPTRPLPFEQMRHAHMFFFIFNKKKDDNKQSS